MRSYGRVVVLVGLAACGSVSNDQPDANTDSAALTLTRASRWVQQNKTATVDFTIERGANVTGPLTVHVTGLPGGVTANDVPVAAGESSGTITFSATSMAAVGETTSTSVELLKGETMLDAESFGVFVAGPSGTLDTTFGTAGRVTFPLPDPATSGIGNGSPRSVMIYPAGAGANAGKILIAAQLDPSGPASTTRKLAVIRLNADGTPDNSFGTSGYSLVEPAPSNGLVPVRVLLDSQERVIVIANRYDTNTVCYVYIRRLLPNGVLDPAFATFDANAPGGYCGHASAGRVITGDKILSIAGWNNPDGSERPLLMMTKSDGTPDDTAFSGSFALRMPNPSSTKPTWLPSELIVDSMGRFVVGGYKCEGGWNNQHTSCESVVGRFNVAGAWDTTFGVAAANGLGYSALTFGTTGNPPNEQSFYGLAVDGSDNIIAVGWSEDYANGTIAKFLGTTGAVDTSFGSSGRLTPTLVNGATIQELTDVEIDAEGRLVLTGYAVSGGPLIVTTRYSANGVLDTSYGTNGIQTAPAAALDPKGALQPDGRLIVIGAYPRSGNGSDAAVWRFWP
jgi:uncharacterized delta-60 repeat protein